MTWHDLIGLHSWLQQYNSRIGMTPDPSSLVKGLARQTNIALSVIIIVVHDSTTLAYIELGHAQL